MLMKYSLLTQFHCKNVDNVKTTKYYEKQITVWLIYFVKIANKIVKFFPHRESNPGHGGESAGS